MCHGKLEREAFFQGNSQFLSLRGFRKSSGACPTACLLSSRHTLKACKMVRRPGWSNNLLPAKEVTCDIKGDTRPSWFTRLSCCFVRATSLILGTGTRLWFGHGCSGHRMLLEHERYYDLGMDALVTVCSWNTNVVIMWAWMLWSPYALGSRTLLLFGHGCSGHRMLLEHERYYDLGMDALVIVCSRNTNGIMIWANVIRGIRSISGPPNQKKAMGGIRSISGPRNTSNVWFVPRRPHPKRPAKYAFFCAFTLRRSQ